eukprot:6747046-Prorocentrum_lima.AAC.1
MLPGLSCPGQWPADELALRPCASKHRGALKSAAETRGRKCVGNEANPLLRTRRQEGVFP